MVGRENQATILPVSGDPWIPAKTKTGVYQSWRGIEAEMSKEKNQKGSGSVRLLLEQPFMEVITVRVETILLRTMYSMPSGTLGSLGREGCYNRRVLIPPEGQGQGEGPCFSQPRGWWREGRVWGDKRFFIFEWCVLYTQKWEMCVSYVDGYQDVEGQYSGKVPFPKHRIKPSSILNMGDWCMRGNTGGTPGRSL